MRFSSVTGVESIRRQLRALRRVWVPGVLLGASACAPAKKPAATGSVDDLGDSIVVHEGTFPARVVALDPSITEILFALGMGDRLVGRTRWDLGTEAARALPDLGDGIRPNVEAVLSARPQLVFLYASGDNRAAARTLRAAGVQVVSLRIDRIADFARVAELVGRLTGRSDVARVVVDSVSATLDRVRRATSSLAHPRVFIHAWESPLLTIGGGSFLSELVTIAGATNVFADLPSPSPQVSFEEVLRRDPDAVLGGPRTRLQLTASERWRALPAVRAGHVLVMDTLVVARPSVRLGEAAVSLARLFHPGVVD